MRSMSEHQDINPEETKEWLDALNSVIDEEGSDIDYKAIYQSNFDKLAKWYMIWKTGADKDDTAKKVGFKPFSLPIKEANVGTIYALVDFGFRILDDDEYNDEEKVEPGQDIRKLKESNWLPPKIANS